MDSKDEERSQKLSNQSVNPTKAAAAAVAVQKAASQVSQPSILNRDQCQAYIMLMYEDFNNKPNIIIIIMFVVLFAGAYFQKKKLFEKDWTVFLMFFSPPVKKVQVELIGYTSPPHTHTPVYFKLYNIILHTNPALIYG